MVVFLMCFKSRYITNVGLYNDHHIWLLVNHSYIKRYARYTSENAQVVLNIVKYRKPINADNLYFMIIQNNVVKRKKDIIKKIQ